MTLSRKQARWQRRAVEPARGPERDPMQEPDPEGDWYPRWEPEPAKGPPSAGTGPQTADRPEPGPGDVAKSKTRPAGAQGRKS